MRWLVIPFSRSSAIGNGLTYLSHDDRIRPGVLVRMKLRGKPTQGIVIADDTASTRDEAKLSPIDSLESEIPLLPMHSLQTLQWVATTYRTTLRQALTVFLPPPPWHLTVKSEDAAGDKEEQFTNDPPPPRAVLTPEQIAACDTILAHASKPTLLFGVAGSGKTEVYADLIRTMLERGKQSILLVPEIFLAEHVVDRLLVRLPRDTVEVLHSHLSPPQRRKAWMRVRTGDARVVIGSRSALFAPCNDLGLIILDEEHEWTYKNEQTPRYHARETAETLARYSGAALVLGSATPSIETWDRCERGLYHIARLTERYGGAVFPTVRIVDLAEVKGTLYPCSTPLLQGIRERLDKHEQSIVFLNRRGLSASVLCLDCRKRLLSAASQLPYVVHRDMANGQPYLLDHVTNQRTNVPDHCPHCGSTKLQFVGVGTQKLEETLARIFPTARIARADSDVLQSPTDIRTLLEKLEHGTIDILLGTQMVAKGLDLPNVTLAAVLIADIGLSLPHFRAGERTFQLLAQLTGRSGRRNPGAVIIQTYRPTAPEVVAAAEHRTEDYLRSELQVRRQLGYPPATDMIRFIAPAPDAKRKAEALKTDLLHRITAANIMATATAAPTFYGAGHTWHVILKGQHIRELLVDLPLEGISIDVDPVDVL